MTFPVLPAEGSMNWYSHYEAMDEATLRSGEIYLDSFQTGALTDEQLLTDAFAYMQAEIAANRQVPTLVLGARLHTFTTTRVPFNGMRIRGVTPGPKNPEIAATISGTRVRLNVGSGISSWMNGAGAQRSDIYIGDICFESTNAVSQFWDQPTGTLFPAQFHGLTFYGFKHVFGRPAAKALLTQVDFTGHWTFIGIQDVQGTVGGSDCNFWMDSFCNLQASNTVDGADRYMWVFDSMDKTNVGGGLYATAENNWRAIKVIGSGSTRTINFWGCIIEGRNASTPCPGSLMRIESHNVNLWGVRFAHAMSAPDAGENGVVDVAGSTADVYAVGCMYERATGVAETVPLFYGSAGRLSIKEVKKVGTWTGLPRVQDAGADVPATDGTWTLA